jgi:hypothetical protein
VICKGCEKNKSLIDAHIIPKSFYMNLRSDSNHLDVFQSSIPERKSRSFKGEYDQTILCKECDSVFEKSDDYAKKLLIDKFSSFKELHQNNTLVGWDIGAIELGKLKHFFLSVLWRASITQRPFFKRVKLGPHENHIKNIVLGKSEDIHNWYTIVLSKFIPKAGTSIEKTIMDPDFLKFNGLNYYRLYLAGYTVWLKVDKRQSQDGMAKLEINDKQAFIVARDFSGSKESEVLTSAISNYIQHNK